MAHAGTLYSLGQQTLYTLNPANGGVLNQVSYTDPIGSGAGSGSGSGPGQVEGFAVNPVNNLLYATLGDAFGDPALLTTIDPTTGAVTVLSTLAVSTTGIVFDPSGNLYAFNDSARQAWTIDPSTGAATALPALSPPGSLQLIVASSPNGTFREFESNGAAASLYSIDLVDGTSSRLFGPYTAQLSVVSMAVQDGGEAYLDGAGSGSGSGVTPGDGLYTFDATNGLQAVGTLPEDGYLAFAGDNSSFAPEPCSVGLLVAGGVGLFALRKFLR
jgi:hypothetical protein